ncbi:hypothetical protein [Alphaproteobacteria bacterium endosymbiont of Tiliacea citrago]|uniref:hypothetical protein n=1 Tax=Alphaproteobacteria bacterium endosymbiont of Tiliacea citrago TaxID=3077944 RepID=UPI00313BC844
MKKQKILALLSLIISAGQTFVNAEAAFARNNNIIKREREEENKAVNKKSIFNFGSRKRGIEDNESAKVNKKQKLITVIPESKSDRAKDQKHPTIHLKDFQAMEAEDLLNRIQLEIQVGDSFASSSSELVKEYIEKKAQESSVMAKHRADYENDLKNISKYKAEKNYQKLRELEACKHEIEKLKAFFSDLEAQAASHGKNWKQVCSNLMRAKQSLKERIKKNPGEKEVYNSYINNINTFFKNPPLQKTKKEIKEIRQEALEKMRSRADKYNLEPEKAEEFVSLSMKTKDTINNINNTRLVALKQKNEAYVDQNGKITKAGNRWLQTEDGKKLSKTYADQKREVGQAHETNANRINANRKKSKPTAKTINQNANKRAKANEKSLSENETTKKGSAKTQKPVSSTAKKKPVNKQESTAAKKKPANKPASSTAKKKPESLTIKKTAKKSEPLKVKSTAKKANSQKLKTAKK